jgi:D-glycero-D-manno-heptose 1,7-bisphosphate phosphatase
MKNKALFLDRDGIITQMILQKTGVFDSPQDVSQITLVQDIEQIIRYCNQKKISVVEITNQPGVAKGKITLETLNKMEEKIGEQLKERGVFIDRIFRCLHHPDAMNTLYKVVCNCRKPQPGLLLQAAEELNLDLESSVFLGDSATDMEAGISAGCTTILYSHTNDEPHKVSINNSYQAQNKVYSHLEALAIIKNIL